MNGNVLTVVSNFWWRYGGNRTLVVLEVVIYHHSPL